MVKRYATNFRGDYVPNPEGRIVLYVDHLEVVNRYKDRIIELLLCVHGEWCSVNLKDCECGREIDKLKESSNGT